MPGVERCGHGLEYFQFPPVPVPALGQAVHDRQRLPVQPDRLSMGEPACCDVGGTPVVSHGPHRPAAPGVLLRQLSGDRADVLRLEQLERLRDPPVQQPPFRRADLGISRFPEQVVGEVVAVPELVHDPAAPQLIYRFNDHVSIQVARLGEQVEGEVRADRRREAGHLPGRHGGVLETVVQDRGEITGGQRGSVPVDQAAYGLDDVQREPARRRLKQVRVVRGQRPPGNRLRQACRASGIERAERKLGQQPGGPHPDDPVRELRVFVADVIAQCPSHQDRGVRGEAKEESEERQRLLVAPLHVVQDQEGRPPDRDQGPREALEEPVPLPCVGHGPQTGSAFLAALGRHQPAHFSPPGRVERCRS